MTKISYPFAAIPNQIIRGGHGLTNLGVLVVLMSHGRSTASLKTLAEEAGCKRETVKNAIDYWVENGKEFGIIIRIVARNCQPYIIEIDIERCEEYLPPKRGIDAESIYPPKGDKLPPQRGIELPPQRGTKEEPIKNTNKEDTALPSWLNQTAWGSWEQHRKESGKKITPSTRDRQIAFLEKNKSNHVEIIETSIQNGWQGLFPIKVQRQQIKTWICGAKHEHPQGEQCGHSNIPRRGEMSGIAGIMACKKL